MTGTYSKNLPRLYDAAISQAYYARQTKEREVAALRSEMDSLVRWHSSRWDELRREKEFLQMENDLLRAKVEEQRQLLRAMEEGYSMRRTA